MSDKRAIDSSIAQQLWRTWGVFFGRFGRLTEVQRKAIPFVLDGQNVLVSAATASGKTEAVCAPLVERCLNLKIPWRILYISPTRALVNDLYARLFNPLSQLNCKVIRRTGDHRDFISPEARFILTTPESFDSLLCRGREPSGHTLANVVAVVLDEIHLLNGSARGEQLRWLLKRLELLRTYAEEQNWIDDVQLQVIGLSATVPDPHAVCRQFLGLNSRVIAVPGNRSIETVTVPSDLPSTEEALPRYIETLEGPEKILLFCNKRKRVDELTIHLKEHLKPMGYEVFAHHGSLDKKLREYSERALKEKNKVILVATSTLEIGIDIGDVDLVVLDGPAPDVSALLQRIGRGNRRTQKTRVMLCSGDLVEIIVHSAMLYAALRGDLGLAINGKQYGVIIQQLASYIFQSRHKVRSQQKILKILSLCVPEVNVEDLLDHLFKQDVLVQDFRGIRLGSDWMERTTWGVIHSNIESSIGEVLVDEKTGDTLVTGISYQGGKKLSIAGNALQVRRWKDRKLEVRQIQGTDIFDAQWSYVSRAWANRDSQPYCVRNYLEIQESDWPILYDGEGTYVFHLGGSRKRI